METLENERGVEVLRIFFTFTFVPRAFSIPLPASPAFGPNAPEMDCYGYYSLVETAVSL